MGHIYKMYLSKLVIDGFKSFGEKISINLHKGLTVVVGPNGTGKTNILDAIKWVFGTRSLKDVRIDEVKNILFRGVNKNARFAEVSATLANENGSTDEVTISRRLYQDGTFEYYLNGQQVRLKDIKEFIAKNASAFTDYSLFEQNNVDSIIKLSPKERGKFFEDIAGLSYYKLKYDETLKTLQKVNEKFQPLKKKINELEKEKEMLEIEAKQTQEYLATIEELKNIKKKMIVINYKKMSEEAGKYLVKLNQVENDVATLYASLINNSSNLIQIKEKLKDLRNTRETLNNIIVTLMNEKDRIYEELQAKQQEYQNFEVEFNKLVATDDVLRKELTEIKKTIENLTNNKVKLETNIMSLNHYLSGLEEIQTNLNENKKEIQNQIKEAEEKLLGMSWELSNSNNELNKVEEELVLENETLQKITEKIHSKTDIKKSYIDKLNLLSKEIKDLNNVLETEKDNFRMLESDAKISEENKIKKQTTLHFLHLEEGKLKNEQYGMLELIQNEEAELKQYLERLNQKESQYALLFDVIQLGEHTPQELVKFIGIFENAILCFKKIECPPKLDPPVNIFFILPKKINEEQKINFINFLQSNHITCKNETYLENLYAIFSYYINGSANLFALNDNIYVKIGNSTPRITNLYYLAAKLNEKTTNLKKQIEEETKSLNNYEEKIKNIEEAITHKRMLIYEINVELDSKIKEYNNISKEEELLTNEIGYLNNSVQILKNKIKNLLENKHNTLLHKKNTQELITSIKNMREQKVALLTDIEKEFDTISRKIEEQRNIKDNYYNNMMNLKNKLAESKDKLNEVENQLKNIKKLSINNEQTKAQLEICIKNLSKELEENNLLSTCWIEYNNFLKEIEKQCNNEYEWYNNETMKIRKLYSEKKNIVSEISLKLQVIAEKQEELKKICKEEFKKDYDEIQQTFNNIDEDIDELKQKIRQYEEKISEFKSINMNAVDKLNVLQEELQMLKCEHTKLSTVHDELSEFLNNLEKEASCIFEDTVNTISEGFNKYIRKLFEGGKAKLEVIKNDSNYEINLNVQIPNKSIKNLESFSGGERALVSLALLFSLLELKPSPFYILDEIDSSLDDNNLSRLLGLLKEFSYNHQIVMISHNKNTLKIADYIVGVTIGEGSFTRVVGINLEKALSYAS